MRLCHALETLPHTLSGLPSLRLLDCSGCDALGMQPLPPTLFSAETRSAAAAAPRSRRAANESGGAGGGGGVGLASLTSLNLSDCPELTALPPLSALRSLRELLLAGCPRLMAVPPLTSQSGLAIIHLAGCERLTQLPDGLRAAISSGGSTLCLHRCDGLVAMPDLSGLKSLTVKDLPGQLAAWEARGRRRYVLSVGLSGPKALTDTAKESPEEEHVQGGRRRPRVRRGSHSQSACTIS